MDPAIKKKYSNFSYSSALSFREIPQISGLHFLTGKCLEK